MDDLRLGLAFRAVRRRLGLRQGDVAARAGVSASQVSRIERGRIHSLPLGTLRRVAGALDIRVHLQASWRGGELGRTLNRRHAALHEAVLGTLAELVGWEHLPEVSFSVFGERGIVDVVAWHAATRTLLIIEIKSELVDPQELVGVMDRRGRLAPAIGERFGWRPLHVARWVVVADTRTNRRHLAQHRRLLRSAFPADGRRIRAWLRAPAGRIDALSFIAYPVTGPARSDLANPRRVRRVADPAGSSHRARSATPTPLPPSTS